MLRRDDLGSFVVLTGLGAAVGQHVFRHRFEPCGIAGQQKQFGEL